jgi:hypothetical protein
VLLAFAENALRAALGCRYKADGFAFLLRLRRRSAKSGHGGGAVRKTAFSGISLAAAAGY